MIVGKNFNFHSNLLVKSSLIQNLPCYYQEIFCNWYKHLSSPVSVKSTIMSQFLWFNKDILIEKKGLLCPTMSNNGLNDVGQLFDNNGEIKDRETIKLEFNCENEFYFPWIKLIDSIPVPLKRKILDDKGNSINLCIFDCHLIKKVKSM